MNGSNARASTSASSLDAATSKSKKSSAYNVNASSMLGLLSEVSKHADGYKRGAKKNDHDRPKSSIYTDKKGKKPSLFDRSNRGLEARSARDRTHMLAREDLSVEARRVLESRERLEKKAQLYERLARGENINGVTQEQLRAGLLVDFETKALEEVYRQRGSDTGSDSDSDSDSDRDAASRKGDRDESRRVPRRPTEEDEDDLVETQDDFGRTRWVRRSTLAGQSQTEGNSSIERKSALEGGKPIFSGDIALASQTLATDTTYYGDQRHFHVYEPTEEEIAERRKRLNLDAPLAEHFDSKKEIRNRGAGYMQFSADEEERKRQMEELKNERSTTEAQRAKLESQGDITSQREREAQERRQLIEEKRRKLLEKRKAADSKLEAEKRAKVE